MKKTALIASWVALTLVLGCGDDENGNGGGGKTCQGTCQAVGDCGAGFVACEGGKCVMCKEDKDCTAPLFCHAATGLCVRCKDDTNCDLGGGNVIGTGKCHTATGQCTACAGENDCTYLASPGPYCDGSCVGCRDDADCGQSYCEGGKCQESCKSAGCPTGHTCKSDGRCACNDDKACKDAFGSADKLTWVCK